MMMAKMMMAKMMANYYDIGRNDGKNDGIITKWQE